jgi:hypothetical protein
MPITITIDQLGPERLFNLILIFDYLLLPWCHQILLIPKQFLPHESTGLPTVVSSQAVNERPWI